VDEPAGLRHVLASAPPAPAESPRQQNLHDTGDYKGRKDIRVYFPIPSENDSVFNRNIKHSSRSLFALIATLST
jgi:hypothetical protein